MPPLIAAERPVSHFRTPRSAPRSDPGFTAGMTVTHAATAGQDTRRPAGQGTWSPELFRRPVAALPSPRSATAKAAPEVKDPAPTRFAYRMERLWLTPLFRRFMRFGVPVLVAALVVGVYFASDSRRAALSAHLGDLRTLVENRPEFMVKLLAIDGASPPVADAVRAMMPTDLPVSSFRLDLEALRRSIAGLDAVGDVTVRVRGDGVLAVAVTERKPAVLWRTEAGLEMLDPSGHRVATLLERAARPDLPVIAGAGADEVVPEALAILSAAKPILSHVRGLVRIGARRWDLDLDHDQRVLLPEDHAVQAIEEVIALDQAEDILARDLAVIDLRNSDRPTLRLAASAAAALLSTSQTETKVEAQ